jgi:hypothetical protein
MRRKSTLKRKKRFRQDTRKKSAYGGMNKELNPYAAEWRPSTFTAPRGMPVDPFIPDTTMNTNYKISVAEIASDAVAIDCEMVGVGLEDISVLAHVAIVDFNGNEIYNKYVIPPDGINSITHNRFEWSGITKNILRNKERSGEALPFDIVKEQVHLILNNRIIVGHGLINDFAVLEYIANPNMVWDTTQISKYLRYDGKSQKLKTLAAKIGNIIQKNNGRGHSPLEDARAAMNLFRTYLGMSKVNYINRNMRY